MSCRAWTGDAFNGEIAEKTVDCNFWGVVRVWESLRPLVRARKGRLVNVSSRAGNFNRLQSEELKQKFLSKNATSDDIKDLMTKFVEDVKADRYKENGWARNTYGTSKMGLTAISKCWAREEESHGVAVFSCCPGWVRTDVSGLSFVLMPMVAICGELRHCILSSCLPCNSSLTMHFRMCSSLAFL